MNMRELVGRSLNSAHLETHEYESAIDRIGALARSTALGSALFRWGYGGDPSAVKSAQKHLIRKAQRRTKIYKHHKDYRMLERICLLVLHEWKNPQCQVCEGRGKYEADQETSGTRATFSCQTCDGTGLHRFSDMERCNILKVDIHIYRKFERYVGDVWLCLAGADVGTVFTCRDQLERA